jgi:FkbM family methyltransferase
MKKAAKEWVRLILPTTVKAHRIRGGRLKGRQIVTSWHDYPAAITGRTEAKLVDWFFEHVRPGHVWLDVGAHYGYTSIALGHLVGANGRVFAFEPVVGTAGHMSETRRINGLNQIVVIPTALTDTGDLEAAELVVVRGMGEESGGGSRRETLLSSRFDWLWPRINRGRDRIDGIKIDVQGMELKVLRGMVETLRRHAPFLVLELHDGVDRAAVLEFLRTVGYGNPGVPIEPMEGEDLPQYNSNRSYAFFPIRK